MDLFLKIISSALLLFNGIGALYGGWNLMLHPDGSSIQLSIQWLQHTPFSNYLIPGIVLFIANGIFSLFVFTSILFRYRQSSLLIILQGVILTGWIFVQILMIQTIYFLHLILGGVGMALIFLGWFQRRLNNSITANENQKS